MSFSTLFQMENSQIVAPLTKIVALLEKYLWGAFWRFLAWKRALPDSELLKTLLAKAKTKKSEEKVRIEKQQKNLCQNIKNTLKIAKSCRDGFKDIDSSVFQDWILILFYLAKVKPGFPVLETLPKQEIDETNHGKSC